VFLLWAIMSGAAMIIHVQLSVLTCFKFGVIYLGVAFLEHMAILCLSVAQPVSYCFSIVILFLLLLFLSCER
jgi:hypothetical protein